MSYEVRWNGVVGHSFFGRFVAPGQSIHVQACLAVELHETGKWTCPDIEKARAELVAPAAVSNDFRILGDQIEIGDNTPAGSKQEDPKETGATDQNLYAASVAGNSPSDSFGTGLADPVLDSSIAAAEEAAKKSVTVRTTYQCSYCTEKPFSSPRKLQAHLRAVHQK